MEDCAGFLCCGGYSIRCLCGICPSLTLNPIDPGSTEAGLKYPTQFSMGPSNISYILVISLPDLNSTTPAARPFFFSVSSDLAHTVSLSSFMKIHPTLKQVINGITRLMISAPEQLSLPQLNCLPRNFSIN